MFTTEQLNIIANHIESPTSSYWTEKLRGQWDAVFSFQTKDEYLAWVVAWKAQYAQLTTDIRAAKASRKEKSPTYRWDAASDARRLRRYAKAMMYIRDGGKIESWNRKKAALKAAT